MKIFFNRVPRSEPYGGGNQFLVKIVERLKDRGHEVVFHLNDGIDLMFMMDPRPGDIGYSIQHIGAYKHAFPKTKIIHRVNECDKRKGTTGLDDLLIKGMNLSDNVVFISEWLKEYFEKRGFEGTSSTIYNGCNSDHFYPKSDGQLGSTVKLVTHHWSDNWMKGFDLYTELDKYLSNNPNTNIEFTYVGRYYPDYNPVSTKIVPPTMGVDLGNQLRNHDIYITASKFEPCGMHHVEGSASGLPVLYHKDGGGINELCERHGLPFGNFEEFLDQLKVMTQNYNEYRNKIDYANLDINNCVSKYIQLIEEID